MKTRNIVAVIATASAVALLLTACSGARQTPILTSIPTSSGAAASPPGGVPKVQAPLPATVLDGDPCENALTKDQVASFLGQTLNSKDSDNALGSGCHWGSASGSGASFDIFYQTKSDQGISLAYQSVKPTAARWLELDPIDSYPAIGYASNAGVDPNDKRSCVVVVGISDQLAYSVSIIIGNKAYGEGKDSCTIGRDVADAVMTNLKARV